MKWSRKRALPDAVNKRAESTWEKWRGKISAAEDTFEQEDADRVRFGRRKGNTANDLTGEDRMIAKIRRRMREYPQWYETDPEKVAASAAAELDRIGEKLVRDLPETDHAIDVWDIPLSVFNWLYEDDTGEHFVRGALTAWAHAEAFNTASSVSDPEEKARLRASFVDICPPLLCAVLEQLEKSDLVLTFAEKYVGAELHFLTLRAKRPHKRSPIPG